MTVEELKARPEFVMLAPQQKAFVVAICENGRDKIAAAKAAYTAKDDRSAEATANRLVRHPKVHKLLKLFYDGIEETGSKDEALAILWKQIQNESDTKLKLDALKLYGAWKGFTPDKPEEPSADSTDDIIDKL